MDSGQKPGQSSPLGATLRDGGVNFSLYSRNANKVELLLFDREDDAAPLRTLVLDSADHRTYHYWHAFVPDVRVGQLYGYRVYGPHDPAEGLRFDPSKVLLDPYTRSVITPKNYSRPAATAPGDNAATALKGAVIDLGGYDWQGDKPLHTSSAQTIIYEMHVGGFTRNPNSGLPANLRGTYRGLIEKIPYLQKLGITAVELLPIFEFDAQACPPGLVNYWGYQPLAFFAPHAAYSSQRGAMGPVNEFRDMVKALHRAGIEVILDVVFNHTAEGGADGPTLAFRGIDNLSYYILEKDHSQYANYSGCGNTLYANHPVVRRMILDSLRYWVEQMHVDGFRFDLASILARDAKGNVLSNPPLLWDIESEPALAGTKIIAEAWDASGLYQVGQFIGDSWKEWTGRFRDDVRSFFIAASGSVRSFADRLVGSPSIYAHEEREAEQSVNFVTCHDGFTLNDLVSYNEKHNEANGEQNRDGANDNRSWNCGVEGPTNDPTIDKLRSRQVRNLFTATLLALGMPMISMGDEVRRTQGGNNNAYCRDDESNWFDWSLTTRYADILRFVRLLIHRRLERDTILEENRVTLSELIHNAPHAWHGVKLYQPDWGDTSHSLAFSSELRSAKLAFYMMFNAYWEPLEFELPKAENHSAPWRRWIDTSLESPNDIVSWRDAVEIPADSYRAGPRSVVILFHSLAHR